MGGVGIQEFAVVAGFGDAETIAAADDGSGVDDDDDQIIRIFSAAEEGKNAVVGIVGVDPFETMPVKIDFMKGGFRRIEVVQVGDELLNAAVRIPLERVPIEAASFAPLLTLSDFLAHEEELFAGVSVLISVKQEKGRRKFSVKA